MKAKEAINRIRSLNSNSCFKQTVLNNLQAGMRLPWSSGHNDLGLKPVIGVCLLLPRVISSVLVYFCGLRMSRILCLHERN